jgi:outer membrane protein OmpA-like peptidoglycan-associated protein
MKHFLFLISLLTLTVFNQLYAQKDLVKEDFYDAEFFLLEEEYEEALYSFQKVYKSNLQDNANINYRIGICYLNIPGQKEKAVSYLETAVKNISDKYKEGSFTEVFAPADAFLYLGNAYRINNQLDKAIESYNSYLKISLKLSQIEIDYTNQQIESCKRAKEAIKNPAPIHKENLGRTYNTSLNNFSAVFSGEDNSMAYMTAQKFYDAVYFVKKVNGEWTNPINITPQIESDGNQYVCSISNDGINLYLVRIDNLDADILISDFSMGRWSPSKSIGKVINTKFFESHASISPDGKTLYFTSNRTGGLGGMDIYSSNLSEMGVWSEPVNLGNTINTPLNEETPFISADGKTLYFSSQGHTTIGGYDVFTSSLLANKSWSDPEPLPYPINSTDDELFFFPDSQKKGGYITLYDVEGFGDGDLYYVRLIEEEEVQTALQDKLVEVPIEVAPVVEEPAVIEKPVKIQEVKVPSIKFTIKPVFFGFDSYLLSDATKEKLDELTKALNEYPLLNIEVRGYTDAMGPYEYNQMLSEKRALAVTEYLINNGIDPKRLKNKGLSESENIAINNFPDGRDALEGRKFNRRVEFRTIELGGALLIIEEAPVPEELRVE